MHDTWNVVQGEGSNPREGYLRLLTLANALTVRSRLGGDASDALAAVEYADLALENATTDEERAQAHAARAIAFRHRFGLTDDLEDIDEAIRSELCVDSPLDRSRGTGQCN